MDALNTDTHFMSVLPADLLPAAGMAPSFTVPRRMTCDSCGARGICQAAQLGCGGRHAPCHAGTRRVRAGESVYRVGDTLRNLYVSRSGACKSLRLHRDGHQQITGFHLAGEFMGLDAIAMGRHETEAIALEDMVLCVLPYRDIEALEDDIRDVRRGMARMLSREIVREAGLLMLIAHLDAEERLAAFLVDLSERYAARGYSPVAFNLRMTREEIGSYLGMKLETVSRMFSRLQRRGLIRLQGREVRILDLASLCQS